MRDWCEGLRNQFLHLHKWARTVASIREGCAKYPQASPVSASFEGFDELTHVEIDDRYDYGETRYRAFGRIGGRGYAIVFTFQGDLTRLISFHRAHEKELRRYG